MKNFGGSGGISLNRAPSPQSRLDGGSADRRIFSGFRGDISTRQAAKSRGVKFHPFSPSNWRFRGISEDRVEFTWAALLYRKTGRMAGPRPAGIFQDFLEIFLHGRPQNHGVPNSTLSAQVSGDFSEFRQVGRNSPEPRPFTAEPAGWRIRGPPEFPRAPWSYFYTIGRRFTGW